MKARGISRRAWFEKGCALFAGTVVAGVIFSQRSWASAKEFADAELVKEGEGLAKSFFYAHDASKAEMRKTDRDGVKPKDQTCKNCQYYTAEGVLKGSKAGVGKCQMIPTGKVKETGWCNVWVKKR